jgi:hypothetical protein
LRQAMVGQFSNYQAQDISLGDTFYPVRPFVVGPNGLAINQSGMLLPTFLAENIRCSVPRSVTVSKSTDLGVLDFLALLGRPADRPQLGQFLWGDNLPLYSVDGLETPINIIDMSCIVSGNPAYLSASGESFENNLAIWNKWITELSGFLSPLVSIGHEPGVSALMTVLFTNTQQDVEVLPNQPVSSPGQVVTKLARKPSRAHIGSAPTKLHVGVGAKPEVNGYLDTFTEKEILCNNGLNNSINRFISLWILPSALSTGESNQSSLQTWQSFQIQPFSLARAQAGGAGGGDASEAFPTIGARLQKLAAVDVKPSSAYQANEFIGELQTLSKQGRGGLFADIAGHLAGMIFPGAEGIVHGIMGG